MGKIKLILRLKSENTLLKERLGAIVRYVEGINYIDKETILLIADAHENQCEEM